MILNASIANNSLAASSLNKLDQGNVATKLANESSKSSVPSVIISLSPRANAASSESLSLSNSIPPVYTKPAVSSIFQSADPATNNLSSDQNTREASVAAENQPEDERPENKPQAAATSSNSQSGSSALELSDQEMRIVEGLKARDREVRAHEQAHKSVGGQYAGAISLSYQSGPDGRRYAVGGEVPIDVSPISGDPQATIAKMTIVKAAATAPAQPSTQDIMVAAEAGRIQMEAQNELLQENSEVVKASAPNGEAGNDSKAAKKEADANDTTVASQAQLGTFQRISSMASEVETKVDIFI